MTPGPVGVQDARSATWPFRTRIAVAAGKLAARSSRRVGLGSGAVVGGRVTLALEPGALGTLARGRRTALVTGTNGKTTTTALLAAALGTMGPVATNNGGANMTDGLVAALTAAPSAGRAALEVDELHVPGVLASLRPEVLVLLNFSRDQLDRVGEVNHLVAALRTAVADAPWCTLVANADDPLVVAVAAPHPSVRWVATGGAWHSDAVVCPSCARVLERSLTTWSCVCGLRRPTPDWEVRGHLLCSRDGREVPLDIALPGVFNLANAAAAVAAAEVMGVDPSVAAAAVHDVGDVAGRYRTVNVSGHDARLLLVKNPAGATESLALLAGGESEVVLAVNGREADGRDLSWLWDVPVEQLRGRLVTASGERAADLSVRLQYAGVDHRVVDDPIEAVSEARATAVDVVANYTAFRDVLARLSR